MANQGASNDSVENRAGEPQTPITEHEPDLDSETVCDGLNVKTVMGAKTEFDNNEFPTVPELEVGSSLGKYEIRQLLGTGGMGAVYLAFDPMIEREVAVKVLPPEIASRPQALDRFLTEAKATGKLNNQHVVAIYDIGVQDNLNYIVMEVIRGGSVLDLMEQSGSLPWEDACRIVADAADGLEAAHAAGLVHRDIKPENLMLTEGRVVKVVDFGLAKLVDAANHTRTAVTKAGQVMGTPQFMSPEQFSGANIDHRSDIYSLGGTLFQLLTGQFPFDNCPTIVQLMYAHLEQPVPDPNELNGNLPAGCRDVIARAMAKEPQERYQDAAEMARDLRSLDHRQSEPTSGTKPERIIEEWRTLESVCIIEPSKIQALMLRDALAKSGISSIRVHDRAAEATSDPSLVPDVVVTSMHVPDLSGVDMIKKLRTDQRLQQSMLVLNSSDSTVDELIDAGKTGALALVSKKTKPDDILRAVHACTFLNAPKMSFDVPIDPLSLRVLIVGDGDQIPYSMAELIRSVGLLDVEITTLVDLGTEKGPVGKFDLAILLRTAGDATGDTKLYAGRLLRVSEAKTIEVKATAAVQVDGHQMTLRALSCRSFTAVTRCLLDDIRLTRILQITL
ncbi:Serine/threonine-protein kinase PknB [Symmachiella macrocystis]|uniref:non-specific serine/threonine protein kinase n=1 Tax=Symmachiella macrocystis TaxID=2527985 RepID=A0A5C6AX96_9PLAN|nr:serine/threonine-protein kinase [Symmachiella macrocystis]TWU04137.1 Serine/threonine-protein kinase PknB [Symmachiella macrocystis]